MKLSTGLTAVGFLPSVGSTLSAGWRVRLPSSGGNPIIEGKGEGQDEDLEIQAPFLPLLPYALLTSSFSFFLFSFQVHEKTILVPLLPMTLLLSGAPVDSAAYAWGVLVNNIGVFRYVTVTVSNSLVLTFLHQHVAIAQERRSWTSIFCCATPMEQNDRIQPTTSSLRDLDPAPLLGDYSILYHLVSYD
jgi:hypothetical protein